MPKTKNKYPEVKHIKKDISSLKADTIELAKHVKHDGSEKTNELKESAVRHIHDFTEQSEDQLKSIEAKIKGKPLQSIAIAFAAGLALSMVMRRR